MYPQEGERHARPLLAGVVVLFLLAACAPSGSHEIVQPVPPPVPVVAVAPGPSIAASPLSISMVSSKPGFLPFLGPPDGWLVTLRYTRSHSLPHTVVETDYEWGALRRHNVKVFDDAVVLDHFSDQAWMEPLIVCRVKVYPALVAGGDWFGGFCMGQPSDYWGSIPPWWQQCPPDPAHPAGYRYWSGQVITADLGAARTVTITITNWTSVSVQ
jgi:hypothetical protein